MEVSLYMFLLFCAYNMVLLTGECCRKMPDIIRNVYICVCFL